MIVIPIFFVDDEEIGGVRLQDDVCRCSERVQGIGLESGRIGERGHDVTRICASALADADNRVPTSSGCCIQSYINGRNLVATLLLPVVKAVAISL